MDGNVLVSKSYKNRLYKITFCSKSFRNIFIIKHEIFKIFRKHCEFAKIVKEHNCELKNFKNELENDYHELEMFDTLDINKMDFDHRKSPEKYTKEFFKLEVLAKPDLHINNNHKQTTFNTKYQPRVTIYREFSDKISKVTEYITKEIDTKIQDFLFANSDEIKDKIQLFSDAFIRKWAPTRPRNVIEMLSDYEKFKENMKEITDLKIEYIDDHFIENHITPIEIMIKNTQEYYLKEVSTYNNISKAIFTNKPKVLTKELSKVSTDINEKIGSLEMTPLMFACIGFPGHTKNVDKNCLQNIAHIINVLIMYGSDLSSKDVFGFTIQDYVKFGSKIFGQEHCSHENEIRDQITNILKRYTKEIKNDINTKTVSTSSGKVLENIVL